MDGRTQHLLFLYDPSPALKERVDTEEVILSEEVRLISADFLENYDSRDLISSEALRKLSTMVALSAEYGTRRTYEAAKHALNNASLALQLVKPTRHFQEYWIDVSNNVVKDVASAAIKLYATNVSNDIYLQYQQHHALEPDDIDQARRLMPLLSEALKPGFGSWQHPHFRVHRAILFFGQGYGVNLGHMRQFLWAAGLDCLFSSRRDPSQWGAKGISKRMCQFLGKDFRPYENVGVPEHQKKRENVTLQQIGKQIFKLRNAYVHGLSIPPGWLTAPGQPTEQGRAYQLLECTEISLRASLRKVLEDRSVFEIFSDAERHDRFFDETG